MKSLASLLALLLFLLDFNQESEIMTKFLGMRQAATFVFGQELQYGCISCGDIFDRCELDCAWTKQETGNVTEVTICQEECAVDKDNCVDSNETMICSLCVLTCSEQYDSDMRVCLAQISRKSKGTYGDSLSECELLASFDMDSCMDACREQHEASDDQYYTEPA